MKKVVAFLLVLFIFVSPVTTLVKADVVIGDNDETIINENATILGRKLALMESFSDLALSGVSEFSISNTSDVDSYLDSLWQEVNNAIDSLSDGSGFQEISNTLKSKYFTNLVQYKDYINNRGNYLANLLQNPATSLLSTYFADNIFGKVTTTKTNLSLPTFQALSRYNNSVTPTPDPNYLQILDVINGNGTQIIQKYDNSGLWVGGFNNNSYVLYSLIDVENASMSWNANQVQTSEIIDINIISNNGSYSFIASSRPVQHCNQKAYYNWAPVSYTTIVYNYNDIGVISGQHNSVISRSRNTSLQNCLYFISNNFKNVNIYVDGVAWSIVGDSNNPTLDIDGFLKIFGNDNPLQYELKPNTQIDYDQLYQVIYNAIRDNLPISQGDINYYDSHDTIYSPTIINNYGEEEGDESDLIDTILDYAVIPKFDTAIATPMRQALTNGVIIMNNSITNVIPDEILLILGACFFLLLFAVVINRMIK